MKICFFSPYLSFPHHTGGGEKHLFDIANILAQKHQVTIALPDSPSHRDPIYIDGIKKTYARFMGEATQNIEWIPSPLGTSQSLLQKVLFTRKFDYLWYVSDGSIFISLAKKNIFHLQIPLSRLSAPLSVYDRWKLSFWKEINSNSFFTKQMIEYYWKVPVTSVLQPMVNTAEFKPHTPKQPIILSVGRFFKQLHSKRQDVILDIYIEFMKKYPKLSKQWKLILAGSVEDEEYVNHLKEKAKNLPVEFCFDIPRSELIDLYNQSAIYIHAAGYEINQQQHPEKVEHFGITTVEAMAAGCVPLVVGKGGQVEVLGTELKDQLWQSKSECLEKLILIINNADLFTSIQKKALVRSKAFDKSIFVSKVDSLFKPLS